MTNATLNPTHDRTPGYNTRLSITFSYDKRGRKLAHYWSPRAGRLVRIGLNNAEVFVATGQADRSPSSK